jgi:hypothetical protein
MIRKDVIIAVLATFCLTTTLFLVLPTRSGSSAVGYDSWADINDDGKIDMRDIGYTAAMYGAFGVSTRNVNVTNWPSQQPRPSYTIDERDLNISWSTGILGAGWWSPPTETFSYGKIFIHIAQLDWSYSTYHRTTVWLRAIRWVWGNTVPYSYNELATEQDFELDNTPLNLTAYAEPGTSSNTGCNFTVEAGGFYFVLYADSEIETGWVMVRAQLYLAD